MGVGPAIAKDKEDDQKHIPRKTYSKREKNMGSCSTNSPNTSEGTILCVCQ